MSFKPTSNCDILEYQEIQYFDYQIKYQPVLTFD